MHAAVAQNKLHDHYCLQRQLRHNIWATGAQSRSFCLGAYSAPHPLNNVKGSRPDLSPKFAPPVFNISREFPDLRRWTRRRRLHRVGTRTTAGTVDSGTSEWIITTGEFKGGQGGHAPPRPWPPTSSRRGQLAPLECKKTGSRRPGEHTAFPRLLDGCPSPRIPFPALGPLDLGLRPSPLTRNRRLGPSQHDGLDPPVIITTECRPTPTDMNTDCLRVN